MVKRACWQGIVCAAVIMPLHVVQTAQAQMTRVTQAPPRASEETCQKSEPVPAQTSDDANEVIEND